MTLARITNDDHLDVVYEWDRPGDDGERIVWLVGDGTGDFVTGDQVTRNPRTDLIPISCRLRTCVHEGRRLRSRSPRFEP